MVLYQWGQQSPYDKTHAHHPFPTVGQGSNRAGWKTPVPTRSSATDLPVAEKKHGFSEDLYQITTHLMLHNPITIQLDTGSAMGF